MADLSIPVMSCVFRVMEKSMLVVQFTNALRASLELSRDAVVQPSPDSLAIF